MYWYWHCYHVMLMALSLAQLHLLAPDNQDDVQITFGHVVP